MLPFLDSKLFPFGWIFSSLFCSFSSSKSSTSSSTNQIATNQQVGASEGAIAVGANSTVSIESLDAGLAIESAKENGATSRYAIGSNSAVAARAIESSAETAARSIAGQNETVGRTLDFAGDVSGRAIAAAQDSAARSINLGDDVSARSLATLVTLGQNQQNFAEKTIGSLSSSLTRNAGDAASTVINDTVRNFIIGAVVIGGIFLYYTSKKRAA